MLFLLLGRGTRIHAFLVIYRNGKGQLMNRIPGDINGPKSQIFTWDQPSEINQETAVPYERCWEVKTRERAIRLLVKNVIDYDLAESATVQITGDNRGFEEAVVRVCMENRREPELQNIKRIAAQAIEIRRAQLDSIGLGASTEWTEQQTVEFTDALSAFIEDDLAGYDSRTAR